MTLYLKWTNPGRVPSYQGGNPIPYRKWTPTETPVLCRSGWHACRWEDVPTHAASELWVCELGGDIVEGDDKVAASRLRLVRRVPLTDSILRLWAADCAEAVLPLFEAKYPNDDRPRKAIEAARAFAEGQIGRSDLAVARGAAWTAAGGAAGTAAGAAAWAAARAAAGAAAGAAAWTAAGAAARTAAGAVARDAQADRLLGHYFGLDPADFAHRERR